MKITLLTLCSLLIAANASAQEPIGAPPAITQTVTVLERVVPRECLTSVKFKDLSKCQITGVELGADSHCRGNVGDPLVCTGFVLKVNDQCKYVVTKRTDCENVNVKKVQTHVSQ